MKSVVMQFRVMKRLPFSNFLRSVKAVPFRVMLDQQLLFTKFIDVWTTFQDFIIQGEEPVLWPVWFRAAIPGMMSLYITVYYEMGDVSSIMRYRTLRMCHFFEVYHSSVSSVLCCAYFLYLVQFLSQPYKM